ncbi:hypothetical protein OTERR_07070 [Oryzomicrobium terrae]|uniref:Uncharacterized protein n=1 Tax=Oryzomicrobium terrae TaxID=1735038 RepID=A0A5C1E5N7_9RHOO|nr:diguanylate cyclase [Oryzomicrobium terrae]QEL64183.1 hypothetical protein OTERR_07070 [Oryzomicrobium terrae]
MPPNAPTPPAPPPLVRPNDRPALAGIAAGVAAVLLGCILYWLLLTDTYRHQVNDIEHQTQLRATQTSQALLAQVESLMTGLDVVAQKLAVDYENQTPASFDKAAQTVVAAYPPGAILQISVVGKTGQVLYSTLPSSPGHPTNIADREHFRVHADGGPGTLFISKPVLGRLSHQWSIQLSRPMHRNGAFDGVVVISLSPGHISNFFRSVFGSGNDVVVLLRQDGSFLARSKDEDEVMGKTAPQRNYLQLKDQSQGSYEVAARTDGIVRYYAWTRARAYPLIVNVGLDKEAALAGVRQTIRTGRLRNLVGTAAVLAGTLAIAWLLLFRLRAKAQLRAKDERLHKLVTQVPGAIYQYRLDPDGSSCFPYASPGIADIYELDPAELAVSAARVFERIHPDDLAQVSASIGASAQHLTPWDDKYRVTTNLGGIRWLHGFAQPERQPDGSILWHGYLHDITAEHTIQQALQESEERLRLTLDAVQDGLWEWDSAQGTLHWDRRCYELLGYPDQAFPMGLGAFFDLVHPLDLERCRIDQAQHLAPGQIYRTEFRLRRADGDWLWVESRGQLLSRSEHRPARMLGTLSDISERVTQAQVRRALLDQSAAAIFLATPDRRISHANARALELFAPDDQTLVGRSFRTLHPDDASFAAFSAHYQTLRQAGSIRLEWCLRDNRGQLRWFSARGSLLDEDAPNGNVIWTLLDTDAQHRAMDALALARQRLTAIIEQFPGGVLVEDQGEQRIIIANQAFCALSGTGTTPQELVGRPHAELAAQLPTGLLAPPASDEDAPTDAVEWEWSLADGRSLAVERITLQGAGAPIGLFWFIRDISEHKRRETALAALAATDPLTGLANRRTFMARMHDELSEQRRGRDEPSVLVMLDLDHFKRVNDTYGHAAGDQVLQHLAGLMQADLRRDDLAGRLGGEEFAILLSRCDLEGGSVLAERLRADLERTPVNTDAGPVHVTASLGITLLRPPVDSPEDCLARADAAQYEAKHRGRNRVVVWTTTMGVASNRSAQPQAEAEALPAP